MLTIKFPLPLVFEFWLIYVCVLVLGSSIRMVPTGPNRADAHVYKLGRGPQNKIHVYITIYVLFTVSVTVLPECTEYSSSVLDCNPIAKCDWLILGFLVSSKHLINPMVYLRKAILC